MLRALALACCLSGCHIVFDLDTVAVRSDGGGAGDDDMAVGDSNDSGPPCYGGAVGGFISVCLEAGVDDAWSPVTDIDTDTAVCEQLQAQTGGPELCIIAAVNIVLDGPVTVHGSRPLVIVATETLSLTAALNVNSTLGGGGRRGPGADPTSCMPGQGVSGVASGGGAGGTFGTLGGNGGSGDGTAGGGAQPLSALLPVLRGGCPGGNGGGFMLAKGGGGGGAVYLIARTELSLLGGTINASGMAGRRGAQPGDGGGGGGSGGMIVLDARLLSITNSFIIAHGVGAGGGAGDVDSGTDGGEVSFSNGMYSSPFGFGGINGGGNGGSGTSLTAAQGSPGSAGTFGTVAGGSGGGGGGGHGVIQLFGTPTTSNSVISPAPRT